MGLQRQGFQHASVFTSATIKLDILTQLCPQDNLWSPLLCKCVQQALILTILTALWSVLVAKR